MDVQAWVTIVVAALAVLGTYLTVRATKGKTSQDAKTAFDQRVDERMSEYADRLEKRLETMEASISEAEKKIDDLEAQHRAATRRENLLYRYTARLRNHIIEGLKPPPPPIPEELVEWYENFGAGPK